MFVASHVTFISSVSLLFHNCASIAFFYGYDDGCGEGGRSGVNGIGGVGIYDAGIQAGTGRRREGGERK